MTPFASGTQPALANSDRVRDTRRRAHFLRRVSHSMPGQSVSTKYVLAKYGYATQHVKVEIDGPPEKSDADITAKVTYEFPFNVPGHRPHPRDKRRRRPLLFSDHVPGDDPQRRPAETTDKHDWNRLWNARITTQQRDAAATASRRRAIARHGKITLVTLFVILGLIVLTGFVGNAGHVVTTKVNTQNAADAIAFSSAQWMARGMNAVTATNHLLGETTAWSW